MNSMFMEKGDQSISLEDLKREAIQEVIQEEEIAEKVQLVVFKLAGAAYALPIDHVKEVITMPRMAKVPHAPPYLRGAINVRGSVIAMIDLAIKFRLNDTAIQEEAKNYTLVIEHEKYKIGLVVEEVPYTITTTVNDIDDPTDVLQFSTLGEECVNGIVKVDDQMIILVDIIAMLEADESLSKI